MKRFNFWQKWLLVFGVITIFMGVIVACLSFMGIEISYINAAFWENGVVPPAAKGFQVWIYGTYGAMTIVFGLFVVFIAKNSFKKKEKWAWNCLIICFSLWFAIDTFFSVYAKMYTNVLNNFVFFVLLMLPLIFTKKHFK